MNELSGLLTGRDGDGPPARIVRALSERGALSAGQIVRITGLAKSTVSVALAELRRQGVIVDAAARGGGRSQVGRPATRVVLNPEAGTCIGVQVGLDFIQAIVADVSHAILANEKMSLPHDFTTAQAVAATEALCARAYAAAGLGSPLTQANLLGVGVAVAGPIDPRSGRVYRSSMVPTWAGIDIPALFAPIFGRPVLTDNESNCAAIAEMMWGAASGHDDFVFFKMENEGIGGAVVNGGRIVSGVAGAGGEFGHICIEPDGDLCRCGNRGCLELYAGFGRVLRLAETRFGRHARIDEVIAMARQGDVGCRRLIADTAAVAGRGLGIIGTVVNPGLIVVGGRLAKAGDLLLDPLTESYDRHTLIKRDAVPPAAQTRIVCGALIDNDSCLGAVGMVLRHNGRLA
ncbi:MAG: ROK family transcriptional regulator [Alphaproteobacteria bacterium]